MLRRSMSKSGNASDHSVRSLLSSRLHCKNLKQDEVGGGHLARMVEMRNGYKFWSENLKRRDHSEEEGTGGMIILEQILR